MQALRPCGEQVLFGISICIRRTLIPSTETVAIMAAMGTHAPLDKKPCFSQQILPVSYVEHALAKTGLFSYVQFIFFGAV